MGPENRILVERIVVVMASPCADQLDRLEGWHAMCQCRPDRLVEQRVIDLEIKAIGIGLLGRRDAADVSGTLRPEVYAGRVDQQWRALDRHLAIEGENETLARTDWQVDAGHGRDLMGMVARAVDHSAAG